MPVVAVMLAERAAQSLAAEQIGTLAAVRFCETVEALEKLVTSVPARRTKHQRFNDLTDPEPIPKGRPYASVIQSDVPVVVQHTRLDSRQADNALITTMAFAAEA